MAQSKHSADDALLERLRAEFVEMPGLTLTRDQAQRLCGVEQEVCQRVMDLLVSAGFLCVKPNGAYARLTDGPDIPRPRPAKADLEGGERSLKSSA